MLRLPSFDFGLCIFCRPLLCSAMLRLTLLRLLCFGLTLLRLTLLRLLCFGLTLLCLPRL
mgnify:CR=1 FL=1